MSERPVALVTGASSGIGEAIAVELAGRGHDLVVVARSEQPLQALASRLTATGAACTVIAMDLAVPGAGSVLADEVERRGITVDVLVNNAGFADFGDFATADLAKLLSMVQLNVLTLTELTHRLLPAMISRKRGRVMNLASTAAFFPGPGMSVYYATKAYVLSLSEALAEELKGSGVTVTALCPGPTQTGFQARAAMEHSKLVRNRKIPGAAEVARFGVAAMLAGKPTAVVGLRNRLLVLSPRFLPRRMVPGIVAKAQAAHD